MAHTILPVATTVATYTAVSTPTSPTSPGTSKYHTFPIPQPLPPTTIKAIHVATRPFSLLSEQALGARIAVIKSGPTIPRPTWQPSQAPTPINPFTC